MNKKILFIAIGLLTLISCGEVASSQPNVTTTAPTTIPTSTPTTAPLKTYTITWKNHDGSVLETDKDVVEGTMPSYNGATPTKDGNSEVTYIFNGWTPTVEKVSKDATYTATFFEYIQDDSKPGISPTLNSKNEIEYGFYPQTNVNDLTTTNQLNTLSPNENGWYFYNGEYYVKETAKIYNTESYKFDNGTSIVEGTDYWFKCETIKWKILKEADGNLTLLSTKLLDATNYYDSFETRTIDSKTVYSNNYKESNIREFLNNDFYNEAFNLGNDNVLDTLVVNEASTTNNNENKYVCENTTDKVFLLTYQDYISADYGFESNVEVKSETREAKTTDYARARGAFCNVNQNYTGAYWTRTPSSEYDYCTYNINSTGFVSEYVVLSTEYCIRPSISINI